MAEEFSLDAIKSRMSKSVASLRDELSGLRTGRATTTMLDPVVVDVYGSKMPLNQVATVSAPEPRLLSVQVWDRGQAGAVEKAIRESNLGLNPMAEGGVIRIPIPELNEERRRELVKVAQGYAENARVAVRHVRRDGMDQLKKAQKASEITEDDLHSQSDLVQKATDASVGQIDEIISAKEQEIMQV